MARWAASQVPVTFVTFDLLHLDGQDLTGIPLVERKRLLDELHLVGPAWATNGWHPGDGDTLFQVHTSLGTKGWSPSDWTLPTCRDFGHGPG
jgi:bifunctional non-homologous end joining protein LigD